MVGLVGLNVKLGAHVGATDIGALEGLAVGCRLGNRDG